MAAQLFLLPFRPAIGIDSLVIAGAKLNFYLSGTLTKTDVYTDSSLSTALPNPVVANSAGVWPKIYFDTTKVYRVTLESPQSVVLNDADPYLPGTIDGLSGDVAAAVTAVAGSATAAQTARTGAETARDKAQDWAEGTGAPGGGSTKSAKSWAAVAQAGAGANLPVLAPLTPLSVTDTSSKIAEYFNTAGVANFANIETRRINGIRPEALILNQKYKRANYLSSCAFMGIVGQSLASTTFGGSDITTTQVGRAQLFPWNVANPSYTSLLPATVANQPDNGEFPGFALVSEPYRMLERENALIPSQHNLTMVAGNNALGSTSISSNSKGSARYNRGLAQLTALKQYGIATGTPVVSFGNFAMAGEFEQQTNATAPDVKLIVQQWARDFAADHRAILTGTDEVSRGQTFDPALFIDTTCAYVAGTNVRGSPRGVHLAAVDYHLNTIPSGFTSPPPVIHTTPTYPLGVPQDSSGVHPNSDGSYNAGAYGALAVKRVFLDVDPSTPQNLRWPPMYIIGVRRIGNTAILKIQMRAPGTSLQWGVSPFPDGTGVSEQQDYGFGVWNGSTLLPIAKPKIVSPDEVAITLSSGTMTDGLRIGYGLDRPATKMLFFTGGAGNLRDDYGDLVVCQQTGWPMHNWFPLQGIVLDSSPATFTRFLS